MGGWRYYFLSAGANDEEGALEFYPNGNISEGSTHEFWGFSAINRDPDNPENRGIRVPVIRLSTWIRFHILARKVPLPRMLDKREPSIMIKMDVEGYEYRLLTDLVVTGVLCNIDAISVETHHHKPDIMPAKLHRNVSLAAAAAEEYYRHILLMINASTCKTHVYHIGDDDERYLKDGMPYPSPATPADSRIGVLRSP